MIAIRLPIPLTPALSCHFRAHADLSVSQDQEYGGGKSHLLFNCPPQLISSSFQPIFLHRNLNYMSQRMSRTHKRRASFKIDSLLAQKLNEHKAASSCFGNNMTIMFQGYFDRYQSASATTATATTNQNATAAVAKTTNVTTTTPSTAPQHLNNNNNNNNGDPAKPSMKIRVEVLLLKIAQKKRKESSSTSLKPIGVVEIPLNPPEQAWDESAAKFPTLSLGTELLDPADGPVTQILVFRSQPVVPALPPTTIKQEDPQHFTSELMIFDKIGRCLLTEGEYQLSLQEVLVSPAAVPSPPASGPKNSCSPKKYASWENLSVFHSDSSGFEDQFDKSPIVKFQLHWTEQPFCGDFERLCDVKRETEEERKAEAKEMNEIAKDNTALAERKRAQSLAGHEIFGVPSADLRIAFHFVHNSVSHQTTEQTNSMECPWCNLNCLSLYSLLKHLKLCHARFAFNFLQTGTTARIEVAINELFDGSYAGAPHNYLTTPSAGYAFSRSGPVRRTSVTHVQVCRPRRLKPSLAEFVETDEALEMNGTTGCGAGGIDRPYLTGHNRLYHHTMTCLPVHPKELDVDSEEENDPRWLKQKTMMMIDEFTDVNEGEKELMKMWNLHVMRHGFVGDCQTALACEMFVELRGCEMLSKNLYRNFVVHMCSLFDYGLVSSEAFHKVVQKLQRSLNESTEAKTVIYEARGQHREHWNEVGYEKYQEQQRQQKADEEEEEERVKAQQGEEKTLGKKVKGVGRERGVTATQQAPLTVLETTVAAGKSVTRSSRELFQKPKGSGSGQGEKAAAVASSSKNREANSVENGSAIKKKTGTSGNGGAGSSKQGPQQQAENPNKRKLERGGKFCFELFYSICNTCFYPLLQNYHRLEGEVQT